MPVFALFFPLPVAIAAILGAGSLTFFDRLRLLSHYTIAGTGFEVTAVKADLAEGHASNGTIHRRHSHARHRHRTGSGLAPKPMLWLSVRFFRFVS
jgi:hypothetical protein